MPAVARTVLVVEDETDVRNIVRRQLESLGHRVLVAEADTEALLLLQGPGAPDVLLTDVLLATGMNGIELASAARVVRPGLPVDLHVRIHGGSGCAAAHSRDRRAAAVQAVHHAAAGACGQRGLRAGASLSARIDSGPVRAE